MKVKHLLKEISDLPSQVPWLYWKEILEFPDLGSITQCFKKTYFKKMKKDCETVSQFKEA